MSRMYGAMNQYAIECTSANAKDNLSSGLETNLLILLQAPKNGTMALHQSTAS